MGKHGRNRPSISFTGLKAVPRTGVRVSLQFLFSWVRNPLHLIYPGSVNAVLPFCAVSLIFGQEELCSRFCPRTQQRPRDHHELKRILSNPPSLGDRIIQATSILLPEGQDTQRKSDVGSDVHAKKERKEGVRSRNKQPPITYLDTPRRAAGGRESGLRWGARGWTRRWERGRRLGVALPDADLTVPERRGDRRGGSAGGGADGRGRRGWDGEGGLSARTITDGDGMGMKDRGRAVEKGKNAKMKLLFMGGDEITEGKKTGMKRMDGTQGKNKGKRSQNEDENEDECTRQRL
ncbi:hypothetical protein DFH07DRAFT_772130 [Mycena maculata]|uniref:Uncharacterized protein n=1 Tax=Mycena maculata TaxID=230809 RepID=A0AAD7JBQ8_9AGAR|nr:hypothetical protein DFH07DRAFT_772130 [Mycena maculata]